MNIHLNFSWEFGLYKIRTVHEQWNDPDSPVYKNCPIELVKYNDKKKSSCYTVAHFERDDEGYYLQSVGSRLFECISADEISEIWVQLQAAQTMLDAYYAADGDY